jgi:glutamyl/glutaminyl-tRNA synthetase
MSNPVITRFAPSPTGHLHIGGARTALFCWAFARRHGGRFVLRIEDTDAARSSEESARGIMEDLAWLGIEWDDGPTFRVDLPWGAATQPVIGSSARPIECGYFQSARVSVYNREIERLVRMGRAYPAFEKPEDLEAQRKQAIAAKQTYRYPRPAEIQFGVFNAALESRWNRALAGEPHVIRFVAPPHEIVVHDEVLGEVRWSAGEMDDFVIRKADSLPTYHFAVVVDDEAMGVTHVLRAQEHLINTPRHVALQQALGYRTPAYAHMPLIFNADGSKMSKRDKAKAARQHLRSLIDRNQTTLDAAAKLLAIPVADLRGFLDRESDSPDIAARIAETFHIALPEVDVGDFRASGYLPEAICNYLALLGWNPGMKTADGKDLEKFDMRFLAEHFSLERIGRTNARFDRAKLLAFNADRIAALGDAEFARRWEAYLREFDKPAHARLTADPTRFALLARTVKPRAKTLRDAASAARFALLDDDAYDFDPGAVEKHLKGGGAQGLRLLRDFAARLDLCEAFEPHALQAILDNFVKEKGLPNPGPIAQALRVAIAGVPVTPGIAETLAILGRERVLRRINRCLETFPLPLDAR